jgi:histidinol-phosphate phosphatase family protein
MTDEFKTFCSKINNDWTLFLDRDGVINHEKQNDYIRKLDEFVMYDGVADAVSVMSKLFSRIFIVTNQKGVGKGLMSEADLADIHAYMGEQIDSAGGRIDKIYYCTDTENDSPNRKPNAGMAYQAKEDYPGIDFSRSLMVGNKLTDMQFGRNVGMHTIFLATTNPETLFPHPLIDFRFDTLPHFVKCLNLNDL